MSGFKRIDPATKREVLERAKAGATVSDLATQYGIFTKTIYTWLSAAANQGVSRLEVIKL